MCHKTKLNQTKSNLSYYWAGSLLYTYVILQNRGFKRGFEFTKLQLLCHTNFWMLLITT